MLSDAHWMRLEPLIEACRPKSKTAPKDLRRTISAIVWRCLDARRPWHERSPGGLWAERTDRTADRDWRWYGWAPRPGVRARPSPVIAASGPAGAGHYRPGGSRAAGSPGRGGWRL